MSIDPKQQFLDDVFFSNTIQGAFQRIKIYPSDWTDQQRSNFKLRIRGSLNNLKEDYKKIEVSDEHHIGNVNHLLDTMNNLLPDGQEKTFGVSQKLMNLFLKYYWCTGQVKTPPHCPIDSIVLNGIGLTHIRWSKMDIDTYEQVLTHLKGVVESSSYSSIAEWELGAFNSQNKYVSK